MDPRLAGERRAARVRRTRMLLPCVFVAQLTVFVLYIAYWPDTAEESMVALEPSMTPAPPIPRSPSPIPPPSPPAYAEADTEPQGAGGVEAIAATAEVADSASSAVADRASPATSGWAALKGQCMEKMKGFWTYQLCVGGQVQQFHTTSNHGVAEQTRTRLGVHAPALDDPDVPQTQRYMDGDTCKLTSAPREVTVYYTCGAQDRLNRVEEPQPCVYEFHATAMAACEAAGGESGGGGGPGRLIDG